LINRLTSDPDAKTGGVIDPDHCYQAVAVNLGDTALCEQIGRSPPRTKCYLLIAERTGSSAPCSMIPEQLTSMEDYTQAECLYGLAVKTKNPQFCKEMGVRNISRMFIGEISQATCLARVYS
jgi:hypothetical protein